MVLTGKSVREDAPSKRHSLWTGILAVIGASVAYLTLSYVRNSSLNSLHSHREREVVRKCLAPIPKLLYEHAISSELPQLREAAHAVEDALNTKFTKLGLDSLAVAVVTANGAIYEGFWGARRANETDEDKRGKVDRHTIYRIASISKLFTTIETYLLRDQGVLDLDDHVTKIFPKLKYSPDRDPITLRQLASHMSGMGRDWPPGSAEDTWPETLNGTGPAWYNGQPFPSHEEFMAGLAQYPLAAPPYTYPIYSNTGFSLLGLANVAATRNAEGQNAPPSHADLLMRDIFVPLGLNGSSFLATDANKANLAVASVFPEETDLDFKDATNPAGGQMSSLSDLVKVMQTLINPSEPGSLLRPSTVREWFRPLHSWWDGYSEVGILWEIFKFKDSHGREIRQYQKLGELLGHHTSFTIISDSGFGVIVLTTGPTMETIALSEQIVSIIQTAFENIAETFALRLLAGSWGSVDGRVRIKVTVDKGTLYVSQYAINGTDVLQTIQPDGISRKTALWWSGGDEFRLAVGLQGTGCMYQWMALDQYPYAKRYSVNLLRLVKEADGTTLKIQVPSINAELRHIPG